MLEFCYIQPGMLQNRGFLGVSHPMLFAKAVGILLACQYSGLLEIFGSLSYQFSIANPNV